MEVTLKNQDLTLNVCIEPWPSLPARQAVVEELTCKSDLIHLPAGKVYETTWTIEVIV